MKSVSHPMPHRATSDKSKPARSYVVGELNEPVSYITEPVALVSDLADVKGIECHGLMTIGGKMLTMSDGTQLVIGRPGFRPSNPEPVFEAIRAVAFGGKFRMRFHARCISKDPERWATDVAFLPPVEDKGQLRDAVKQDEPQFAKSFDLSPGQQTALDTVNAWMDDPNGSWFFKLNGGAGTGKTSVARRLGERFDTMFTAFTGKAVKVLKSSGVDAGTIHGLLANLTDDDEDAPLEFEFGPREYVGVTMGVTGWQSTGEGPDLLIVDEHSMVGMDTGGWIKRWAEITGGRVLLLGDDNQLEPVGSDGFFTLNRPRVVLTEVHRQAEGSPVLEAAQRVLDGHGVVNDGPLISRHGCVDPILDYDMTIVATNKQRRALNSRYRFALGIPSDKFLPVRGEPIQARRNTGSVVNGEIVKCASECGIMSIATGTDRYGKSFEKMTIMCDVINDEGQTETVVGGFDYKTTDGQHLGFGYAITGFKAQGSQASRVYIDVDWLHKDWDAGRFIYTAITRAKHHIHANVPLNVPAPAPIAYKD